jgi:hypothetical protein
MSTQAAKRKWRAAWCPFNNREQMAISAQSGCTPLAASRGGDIKDTDGDGFEDPLDNCSAVANINQADSDNDLIGDACDNCPSTPNQNQKYTTNATTVVNGQTVPVGDACNCALSGVKTGYNGSACMQAAPTPALPAPWTAALMGLFLAAGAVAVRLRAGADVAPGTGSNR